MPLKGQHQTDEAKIKFKEAMRLTWASKMKWDSIDTNLLDVEFNLSSRNSTHNKITIRQFKDMVLSGKDADQIIETGVSKHLVSFLSSFCRGEMSISKQEFEHLYSSGMSLDEMSHVLSIPRNSVAHLRQLFSIKSKGAKFIKRKLTEVPLMPRQREIICGSLFGDASKASPSSVKFVHGGEQKDYLDWKFNEMKSVCSDSAYRLTPYKDERTGFEGLSCLFYTKANTDIESIVSKFYPQGAKVVCREMLDLVGPLGLAVWYQDDGQVDFFHRTFKDEKLMTPVYKFCTDSFTEQECQMIILWLQDKFGLKSELVPSSNGKGWRVKIANDSSETFVKIIEPHVIPSMRYKLRYEDYLRDKGHNENSVEVTWAEAKKCPLGNSFVALAPAEQDEWIRKVVSYLRKNGFNHLLPSPDENDQEARKIFEFDSGKLFHDECIGFSPIGSMYVLSFFDNFWDGKSKAMLSPKEVFNCDKYLSEIVREMLQEERFPRRGALLSRLRRYRGNKSISIFMPCMAKAIYDKYCPDGGRVIDFCAGYGGRLVGAISSRKVLSYVGLEPNSKSFLGLNKIRDHFSAMNQIQKDVSIQNQDSHGLKQFADGVFDLCFTSPPYFDAEEYSGGYSQSSIRHPHYGDWLENFLFQSITDAIRVSKTVIINIANTGSYKIADDLRNWAIKNGVLVEESTLRYPSRSKKYRLESLFIISKRSGSPVAE